MEEQKKPMTIKQYIRAKIRLLNDFGIKLTYLQTEHIKGLKTEIAVDNFAHDLLQPNYSGFMDHTHSKSPQVVGRENRYTNL